MLSEGPLKVVICQQISLGYILLWLGVVVIFSRFYVIGGVNQENGLMPRLIELQTMALTRAMRAQNEVETLGKVMFRNKNSDRSSLKILIDTLLLCKVGLQLTTLFLLQIIKQCEVNFAIRNENGLSYIVNKIGNHKSYN